MKKQDIDKLKKAAKDIVIILPKVLEVKGNLVTRIMKWIGLLFQHGSKPIFIFKNWKEIGFEIADLDRNEAKELYAELLPLFGNHPEAQKYIEQLFAGLAEINQGVQGLISIKKKS